MKSFNRANRISVGLLVALCLVGIFSVSFAQDGVDGRRPYDALAVQRPAPLPDLSAFMLAPVNADFDSGAAAITFTVNDLGDGSDTNTANAACDADAGTGGNQCTLRAAIEQANATPDKDTIVFNIAGVAPFVFTPATPLPVITRSIIIDGTSQTGYAGAPLISIDATGLVHGLALTASNSSIMGLHVAGADVNIQVVGATNVIKSSFIGTNVTGNGAGGGVIGIGIQGATNTIGGPAAADRNVISDLDFGILVEGVGATGNIIKGNIIGLQVDGDTSLTNVSGIYVMGAPKTVIGAASGADNVISGNSNGIYLDGAAATKILGNIIGLNAVGDAERDNGFGIYSFNSATTTIGGPAAGAGNVISSNDGGIVLIGTGTRGTKIYGNIIGLNPASDTDFGNIDGVYIDSAQSTSIGGTKAGQGNVISSNDNGINVFRAKGITVRGNKIGTNSAGTVDLGNIDGIYAEYSSGITVGGLTPAARNLISGNNNGVSLQYTDNAVVQGNYFGTNLSGAGEIPNIVAMIVYTSHGALIGGSDLGAGNVISGSDNEGMRVENSVGVVVQQNLIGTNAAGTAAVSNTIGMQVINSPQTLIGGAGIARNLISGNTNNGLVISAQSQGTRVEGNYIGTAKSGLAPLGNNVFGVQLNTTTNITIGGSTAQARNLISGNGNNGINVVGSSSITITGNYIGSDKKGKTALGMGNDEFGIAVATSADITIGGTGKLANRIMDSEFDGIRAPAPLSNNLTIVGNRISGNGGLGIDLDVDGISSNDTPDANGVQNFPVVNFIKRSGSAAKPKTQLKGTLNSSAYGAFTLHFYAVTTCDGSGNGEADSYLGQKAVLTDANGDVAFNVTFPVKLAPGASVVATATNSEGSTSEFSACFNGLPLSVMDSSGGLRR